MSTITFANPIPEPLKPYFKHEFLYLLESYAAHNKLYSVACHNMQEAVGKIGWSLDRHLTWFMSHFSVEPQDYEFCYIDFLIVQPCWQACYEDKWEEWLDKLVAPSEADIDDIMGAYQSIDEDEDE